MRQTQAASATGDSFTFRTTTTKDRGRHAETSKVSDEHVFTEENQCSFRREQSMLF
jgi:hypothetical protein